MNVIQFENFLGSFGGFNKMPLYDSSKEELNPLS